MKKNKKNKAQLSTKSIAASQTLVTKISGLLSDVERLTAAERKQAAKMRRGAPEVIPTIGHLATKFAVQVQGVDEMQSNLEYAQSLQPLMLAVATLHETLRDEYLRASSASWTTATVTYTALKNASRADRSLVNELLPVQRWFRYVGSRKKAADVASATTPSPSPSPSTHPVPAPKADGAAPSTT